MELVLLRGGRRGRASHAGGRARLLPTVSPRPRLAKFQWRGASRKRSGHRRYKGLGRWVQGCYALIDIICVVLNGVLAFYLRFAPADLRSLIMTGRLRVPEHQPLSQYWGFLLLYVALILLFCRGKTSTAPLWRALLRGSRARW